MEIEIRYLFAEEATYTAYIPVEAPRGRSIAMGIIAPAIVRGARTEPKTGKMVMTNRL